MGALPFILRRAGLQRVEGGPEPVRWLASP
jgi:hypothetical protein